MARRRADRFVLILGAGATMADARHAPVKRQPPLDRLFFSRASVVYPNAVDPIISYFQDEYARDITSPADDSLERVMAALYTDVRNPDLVDRAYDCFLGLVRLFSRWLAETTNRLRPSQGSFLYRVLASYIRAGVQPDRLTIITFNQDLQIEQALSEMSKKKSYQNLGTVFAFPGCYRTGIASLQLTGASGRPMFDADKDPHGVEVLKLHGSLNWYSRHHTTRPTIEALFNSRRKVYVTRRRAIDPNMGVRTGKRRMYSFPVVVPPVTHKAGIFHEELRPLWQLAYDRLKAARHVTVFGYSCPISDFESAGLLQRAMNANERCESISLIDPDPSVLDRYIHITGLGRVSWYRYASDFLGAVAEGGPVT